MANLDDMADEHGLSRDSMRGSEQFIRPDLIGESNRRDEFGRPLTRNQLSIHEATALEQLARQRGDLNFEIEADKRITPRDDLSPLMRGADPIPDAPPTTPPMSDGRFPSERIIATPEPWRVSQGTARPAATTVPPQQAPEPLQSPGTPATRPDAFPSSPTTAPATTIDVPSEPAPAPETPSEEAPPPTEPPNMAATPPPVGGSPASPPPLG